MIKTRRKSSRTTTKRAAATTARKPTAADKAAGRQRATRTAKINARRGIQQNVQGKPSPMDIEREVYRQTRMNTANKKQGPKGRNAPARSRKDANAQTKARKQLKNEQKKKAQNKASAGVAAPPTWVAGTRRPPSKKAVNAAVNAMTDAGFKVPQGMQMVISFAPAPEKAPVNEKKGGGNKGGGQKGGQNKGGTRNKGNQNKGGGGRGGGRRK